MQENEFRYYEFGEFVLDVRRRRLIKNEREVRLSTRNFELLHFLVRNEGRVIDHEELLENVWAGTFVEQSNLKKGISALRQILEEAPDDSLYIKTVPRKGYSFVADVRPVAEPDRNIAFQRVTITEIEQEEIIYDEPDEPAEKPVAALPAAASRAFPKNALFGGLALLVLAAAGVWFGAKYLRRGGSAPDFGQFEIIKLTNEGRTVAGGLAPDGTGLLFCTADGALKSCRVRDLRTGDTKQILAPQKVEIYGSAFAPDNRTVYFWLAYDDEPARSGIYRVSVDGGEPQRVSDRTSPVACAPDGRRIAYIRRNLNEQGENGIFTAAPDFTDEKLIYSFRAPQSNVILFKWSPDSKFVTYTGIRLKDNQKEYYLAQIPADGGAEQLISPPRAQLIYDLAWFPDGSGLAVTAVDPKTQFQQIYYVSYPAGEWQKITNDLMWYWSVAIPADGRSIVTRQQSDIFNLWTGDADGRNFRQITFDTVPYDPDCIWLDAETIVYSAKTGAGNDLWSMNADGQNRRRLTSEQNLNYLPRASRDGQRIFFLSNRSGTKQVWRIDRDGGNPTAITNAPSDIDDFYLMPDDRSVLYSVYLSGLGWTLFKKTIDADDFKSLPFTNMSNWRLSPDGTMVAYEIRTDQGSRIRVSSLTDNKTVTELDIADCDSLVWTKDNKALLFDGNNDEHDEIFTQPLDGGAPKRLTNFESADNIWNFDLSPDGKKLVLRRIRQFNDLIRLEFAPKK
ncbi:MAG: winged helix-turn-helix domain-containing protein [Acidobacteria bacterium]|nr:winged helix-turn-helix domain-containing protein [Acidobacteriota bacterium]